MHGGSEGAPVAERIDLLPSAHTQRDEHDGAAPYPQDLHHRKLTLAFTHTQSQAGATCQGRAAGRLRQAGCGAAKRERERERFR